MYKKIATIFLLLLALTKINAQQKTSEPIDDFVQLKTEILDFYNSLDRNNAETDFLWNYGFIILNDLEQWYADQPIITSLSKWFYIYNAVEQSNFVNNDFLLKDSTLLEYSESNIETPSKIALSLLYYEGEYLQAEEMQRIVSIENSTPDYKPMTIFAGTTLLQKTFSTSVEFIFNPDLFFSDSKGGINQLLVDFGDSKGYTDIHFTKQNTFTADYDCIGKKNIMFKLITDQNDTLISYSKVEIMPYFDIEPNFIGTINDTLNFNLFETPTKGDSIINNDFYYANYMYIEGDDNELDKPIIFV